MMRLFLLLIALLPALVSADHHPSPIIQELTDDWTKFEIGLVLEGDNSDNSLISGSCLRFLKIKDSPKVFYEVLHYKKSTLDVDWSCRETKKSELINFEKMKEIIEKFDQLKRKEKAEWKALPKSKRIRLLDEQMSADQPFQSCCFYRIERKNNLSVYASHSGIYFQKYAILGAEMIRDLAKKIEAQR